MSSILMENNLSSENIKKCPTVLLFGILNSENVFNHASSVQMFHRISMYWKPHFLIFICWRNTKNLGSFSSELGKLRPADVMIFFLALHVILTGELDICGRDDLFFALSRRATLGFKEPFILLRNENMVTFS